MLHISLNLDWIQLHKESAFSDHGASILIWHDGKIEVQDSGSSYRTDDEYLTLPVVGRGNLDEGYYAEAWATEELDENENWTGNYIEDTTGKVMTADEMITDCIEEGDFINEIETWKETLRQKYKDEYTEDGYNFQAVG